MAKKKAYRYPLYLLARTGAFLVYLLPRRAALGLARFGGKLAFWLVRREREKTIRHLGIAFGDSRSPREIKALAREVFENLAETAVDILQFPKLTTEKIDDFVEYKHAIKVYEDLLSEGKGLLVMTAHLGNWELLAGVFAMAGFRGGVLGRKIYYEPYNEWILSLRRSLKVPTIYRDASAKEIFKHLRKNEVIGMLADQDIASLKGVFVDFFNRPAYTPEAPAKIALATGCPMLTVFLVRQPRGRYRVVLGDIIRAEAGEDKEESIRKVTQQWMTSCEKIIRTYPGQWAWMHNRWKTQPKSEQERVAVTS